MSKFVTTETFCSDMLPGMGYPTRLLVISVAFVLVGCSGGGSSDESARDPALVKMDEWRVEQTSQECPDVEQDQAALDLVRSAQESSDVSKVYGEDDPYDRITPVRDHLWTRPNTNGDGVIVTAVRDADRTAETADNIRYRAVWLTLDGRIYPLNTEASGTHGVLLSGLPPEVAQQSGLPEHAVDTERDLGIEDHISFRWHGGDENPLPTCE